MHARTHVRQEHRSEPGLTALTEYADGMIEHDEVVGTLLKAIDDMGIADNTIIVYSTDNGPHQNTWPDAGTTPYRSEKNTNWEGAFRVPAMIRWPGHIKPGSVANGIYSGLDWFPTLLAAAGDTDIKERLLKGTTIAGKQYKNHLDGYNQLDYLTGKADKSARTEFFYFNDDGALVAMRYENWKVVFEEQRVKGTLQIWQEPFTPLRFPLSSSTCAPIPMRSRILHRTRTGTGCSTTSSIFFRRRRLRWGRSSPPSSSIPRLNDPTASPSTKSSKSFNSSLRTQAAVNSELR